MTSMSGQMILSDRLAAFKRVYRWLNLTLIHQACWPLLVLLATAPTGKPDEIPFPWYWARLGAPIAAAFLAFIYLRERPLDATDSGGIVQDVSIQKKTTGRSVAEQARFVLLGLPLMVAAVRLLDGPVEPAGKLIVFGLADVAAYHLIHFGVVVRSYPDAAQGISVATLLFALSWGIHDALLTAIGPSDASPALALLGGLVLGLFIALLSRAIHRWPGGALTAAATHWLLIYLIFGFA
jgi:hypothetical protein